MCLITGCSPICHWGYYVSNNTYCILSCIMSTFLPKFFREKQECALYIGILITYHGYNNGYNNLVYKLHKTCGCTLYTAKYGMLYYLFIILKI